MSQQLVNQPLHAVAKSLLAIKHVVQVQMAGQKGQHSAWVAMHRNNDDICIHAYILYTYTSYVAIDT